MSDLVWDDLKYFLYVANEGSVTGAAQIAKVEHSTVVRRITRLETNLNTRLFHRLVRGWTLTEEGEALRERVSIIEDQMFTIERFAQSVGNAPGSVTLTAPPEFLTEVLTPVLTEFQKEHAEIELRLFGEMKEANLSKGEAEIALRMTKVKGAELVVQKFCDLKYHFYGSSEMQKTKPHRRQFIGYSDSHQPHLNALLLKQAAERPVVMRTSNLRVSMLAASNGVGVALLPAFMAAKCPGLEIIEAPPKTTTRPVYLVMQRDIRKSARVRALADYIKREIPKEL